MPKDESLSAPTRLAGQSGGPASLLEPGTVLFGEYEILDVLGSGGMGAVYRARHRSLGTLRAIKVMRPELSHDAVADQLFLREARTLLEVQHDAVVRCNDLLRGDDGRVYLVMEMVEGPSLSHLLRERRLSPDEVRVLARRVAGGLAAAHARGVIHRDLSPDNIVLPGGRLDLAKLIDFGIAKRTQSGEGTVAEGFKGKLAYASPEQLGFFGGRVDGRSDVFSLGLVLAEAAIGERLPMGTTLAEAVEARRSPPPLPRALPQELRDELEPMLRIEPDQRPSAAQVASGLAYSPPPAGGETVFLGRTAGADRRGPALVVGAAALLVVGLGVGGVYYWRASPSPAPPTAQEVLAPEPAAPPVEDARSARDALTDLAKLRDKPPQTPERTPAEPAAPGRSDFEVVRMRLEKLVGPSTKAGARVFVEPDPVANGAPFKVSFSAECDCQALLFFVDGKGDSVDLVYPSPREGSEPLGAGQLRVVPSTESYKLRAEKGPGTDQFKLVVIEGELAFPPGGAGRPWSASPGDARRTAELAALLDGLQGVRFATAETPLRIR
jgi:tRNA A-37 threonylcarbamoyl transferase component Bud32